MKLGKWQFCNILSNFKYFKYFSTGIIFHVLSKWWGKGWQKFEHLWRHSSTALNEDFQFFQWPPWCTQYLFSQQPRAKTSQRYRVTWASGVNCTNLFRFQKSQIVSQMKIFCSFENKRSDFCWDIPCTIWLVKLTLCSCNGKAYGYYADVSTNCKVFHICLGDGDVKWSFLCPNQTSFHQVI